MYLMDYYTIPISLAGLPSLSVPCGAVVPDGGTRPMPLGCSSRRRSSPNARCSATRTPTNRRRDHAAKLSPVGDRAAS